MHKFRLLAPLLRKHYSALGHGGDTVSLSEAWLKAFLLSQNQPVQVELSLPVKKLVLCASGASVTLALFLRTQVHARHSPITVSLQPVITTHFSGRTQPLKSQLSCVQDSRLKLDHTFAALCRWCCHVDFIKPGPPLSTVEVCERSGIRISTSKYEVMALNWGKTVLSALSWWRALVPNRGVYVIQQLILDWEKVVRVRLSGELAQLLQWCCYYIWTPECPGRVGLRRRVGLDRQSLSWSWYTLGSHWRSHWRGWLGSRKWKPHWPHSDFKST